MARVLLKLFFIIQIKIEWDVDVVHSPARHEPAPEMVLHVPWEASRQLHGRQAKDDDGQMLGVAPSILRCNIPSSDCDRVIGPRLTEIVKGLYNMLSDVVLVMLSNDIPDMGRCCPCVPPSRSGTQSHFPLGCPRHQSCPGTQNRPHACSSCRRQLCPRSDT